MNDAMTDFELLRDYAERHSEAAFTALVERHLGLVYSAALRQLGDPHSAEEVTQATFIILARKSRKLRRETNLSGWLYRTAHFAANGLIRTESRRRQREQRAAQMETASSEESAWEQIAPLLDKAMAQLGDKERDAMLLRFFERRSLVEVGATLGISEEAARKRVARGLEKLRRLMVRRGAVLSVAALAGAISANSVHATPAALTASVVASAKGSVVAASTLTLAAEVTKAFTWLNLKAGAGLGAALVVIVGAATLAATHEGGKTERFDAAGQFSKYANPSGPWSYGWSAKAEAELQLYSSDGLKTVDGVVAWTRDGGDPDVFFNASSDTQHPRGTISIKPKQLALHSGPGVQYSVVRWTAPRAGVCRVEGGFEGISGFKGAAPAVTDVIIRHRNLDLFSEVLNYDAKGNSTEFDLKPNVAAGETIDFLVGNRLNVPETGAVALDVKI